MKVQNASLTNAAETIRNLQGQQSVVLLPEPGSTKLPEIHIIPKNETPGDYFTRTRE